MAHFEKTVDMPAAKRNALQQSATMKPVLVVLRIMPASSFPLEHVG
jgi:hypothetical protein